MALPITHSTQQCKWMHRYLNWCPFYIFTQTSVSEHCHSVYTILLREASQITVVTIETNHNGLIAIICNWGSKESEALNAVSCALDSSFRINYTHVYIRYYKAALNVQCRYKRHLSSRVFRISLMNFCITIMSLQ